MTNDNPLTKERHRTLKEFRCVMADNDGWIIETRGHTEGVPGRLLGAFTSAEDLIAYLTEALKPDASAPAEGSTA